MSRLPSFLLLLLVGSSVSSQGDDAACPLPPTVSSYKPQMRNALSSHPRAGSTWTRFLVEHATGKPCGFEMADWANVLTHTGEDPDYPGKVNQHGILVKTHNSCYGCWPGAPMEERVTISGNSSYTPEQVKTILGPKGGKQLQKHGLCLLGGGWTMDSVLAKHEMRKTHPGLMRMACSLPYDRAVLLLRYPLDNVRSNYHYRTKVLNMRQGQSWSADYYYFPRERGEAWVRHYKTWVKFAEVRPVLTVLYEDMKQNTQHELRRIVDFLGFQDVSDERLECAVKSSTMDKLKSTDRLAMGAKKDFFGSREETEKVEKLSYPSWMIRYFKTIGMFSISHAKLGYEHRDEESVVDQGARRPNFTYDYDYHEHVAQIKFEL